jgi:uncharacterized protein YndB with AHSA1/START domain
MANTHEKPNENPLGTQPRPFQVSRTFPFPRELVFRAWSSAEHLKHWFCPAVFTVPAAEIEFRVGGAFTLCMRSPEGQEFWNRGHYAEIVPNSRLVLDLQAFGGDSDKPLFRAYTEVNFSEEHGGGTRMDVTQTYTVFEPMAEMMIQGAPMGWSQTLDRLGVELERMREMAPLQRSVVHAMFRIERSYAASPAQVFKALSDPAAKAQWFVGGPGYTTLVREMDVRPGGREVVKGRWEHGLVSHFSAHYFDVVPDQRLVYAYEMHLDDRKISASLTTFELNPAGSGTQLVMTEQGAFLDGFDDNGSRQRGSNFLLDAIGRFVDGVKGA